MFKTSPPSSAVETESIPFIPQTKSSDFHAAINLFKSCVGIGILAVPYIFQLAGYGLSIIVLLIIRVLIVYTTELIITMVADSSSNLGEQTFRDFYEKKMGRFARILFEVSLGALIFGTCTSYVIFFLDMLSQSFNLIGIYWKLVFAASTLVLIVPLSLIRNYSVFVKYSMVGSLLIFGTLIMLVSYFSSKNGLDLNTMPFADFEGLPTMIGVFMFAFECLGQTLPIRQSMKKPENFMKIFQWITITELLFYFFFGFISSLARLHAPENMLYNLAHESKYLIYAKAAYAISLIISYPLQLVVLADIVEHAGLPKYIVQNENFAIKNIPRFGLIFIIFSIAILGPSFASFIALFGHFGAINIQFVCPIWASYKVLDLSLKKKILHGVILLVSISAMLIGIAVSLKEIIQKY